MKRFSVALALVLFVACKSPTAPSQRRLVQCCQNIHKCYVPEAGAQVCRAGYYPVWEQR
jgi:hypothetical protein